MINHYNKTHVNDQKSMVSIENQLDNIQIDSKNSSFNDSFQMSTTKKNQLEVSRYYYIDKLQLKYSFDYFNKTIANNFKRLKFLDEYFFKTIDNNNDHFLFDINQQFNNNNNNSVLKFKLDTMNIELKPFEIYKSDQFSLINLCNQITSLDWCPIKFNSKSDTQYVALATLPLEQLNNVIETNSVYNTEKNRIKNLNDSPNLIYIYKTDLNRNNHDLFAILNRNIGTISCVKWRPDCGASAQNTFIGYLLIASSNGEAYIESIQDLTQNNKYKKDQTQQNKSITSINKLNVFETKNRVVLKSKFTYGQCTAGDWSQIGNGGTQIAIGYTSGEIALFQINSNFLSNQYKLVNTNDNFYIYPIKTFNAHQSFIRDLKWCKFDPNILASGSTFSRDLKLWNIQNTDKPIIEYEIFVTEFEFSLHNNHLFITKETNLKGENHLFALDLSFNVFNKEKDETRAKPSLFYTNETMSSLNQSDYLNKLIICDTDGSLILSTSNNPNHWIPKHQLIYNSFTQVASFQILNNETASSKSYGFNQDDKKNQVIVLNLERKLNEVT